jgi:hypothetical protein
MQILKNIYKVLMLVKPLLVALVLLYCLSWFPGRGNQTLNFLNVKQVLMALALHLALFMFIIRGICITGSFRFTFWSSFVFRGARCGAVG